MALDFQCALQSLEQEDGLNPKTQDMRRRVNQKFMSNYVNYAQDFAGLAVNE